MSITNVESIGNNTKIPFWGLRWGNLSPKKCRDDVQFEDLDQHGSELFEMQLPIKFHPNRVTESKVMPFGSPCINWLAILGCNGLKHTSLCLILQHGRMSHYNLVLDVVQIIFKLALICDSQPCLFHWTWSYRPIWLQCWFFLLVNSQDPEFHSFQLFQSLNSLPQSILSLWFLP